MDLRMMSVDTAMRPIMTIGIKMNCVGGAGGAGGGDGGGGSDGSGGDGGGGGVGGPGLAQQA